MNANLFVLGVALMALMGRSNNPAEEIIKVDVNADFPEKELVLQDFVDVDYIALETTDEFITQGEVVTITDNYIVTKNRANDGDLFIFDAKTGKGISKINRKGQSGEEYTVVSNVIIDDENQELFVNIMPIRRVNVYDFSGKFKRSFKHPDDVRCTHIFDFDKEYLIRYDMDIYYKEKREKEYYHALISKKDGMIKPIPTPFETPSGPLLRINGMSFLHKGYPITPNYGDCLLIETSTDTIYNYVADKGILQPAFVRTPSSNPEIFLYIGAITDRYYFMQTMEKAYDFNATGASGGFKTKGIAYDRKEKTFCEPTIINSEFPDGKPIELSTKAVNHGNTVAYQILEAYELFEAYNSNKLSGKLQEIASGLKEDDNVVIMLLKHKK